MTATRPQRGRNPKQDAAYFSALGKDKIGFEARYIDSFKVSLENARRAKKRQWSPKEVGAILKHFDGHIKKGQLATMIECKQCKMAEHPALADRSEQNIRDFVRNRVVTLKKQNGNP